MGNSFDNTTFYFFQIFPCITLTPLLFVLFIILQLPICNPVACNSGIVKCIKRNKKLYTLNRPHYTPLDQRGIINWVGPDVNKKMAALGRWGVEGDIKSRRDGRVGRANAKSTVEDEYMAHFNDNDFILLIIRPPRSSSAPRWWIPFFYVQWQLNHILFFLPS